MVDRRLLRGIDLVLLASLVLASGMGLLVIYSASHTGPNPELYVSQCLRIGLGLVLMAAIVLVDYHSLVDRAELFYLGILGILFYLAFFGGLRAGTSRWLELGVATLQPGELAKISVVLLLGKYFAAVRKETLETAEVLVTLGLAGIPILLVALQPDLGTAATLGAVYAAMALLAGLRFRLILVALVAALLLSPLVWHFAMKDYQKERVYTFLDPGRDPQGSGYQTIQSTIAVGSGGMTGKGWLEGTQSQLQFLPTPHTDFVFAVLAEEFGFVGVTTVTLLYLLIILRCIDSARRARDRLGIYLVSGVLAMFVFQTAYNLAMVGGLVPIKGFPLPLLSYGGSSMLATMIGFGLIMNVRMRRFVN